MEAHHPTWKNTHQTKNHSHHDEDSLLDYLGEGYVFKNVLLVFFQELVYTE